MYMTEEKLNKLVIHLRNGKAVTENWLVGKLELSTGEIDEFVEQGYLCKWDGQDAPHYSLTEKGKEKW